MANVAGKQAGRQPRGDARTAGAEKQGAERSRVLKPSQCKAHMRKRLAEEFGGIVDGFVKQAKSGSCPHVKLATEIVNSRDKVKRAKTPAERMLEEFAKKPAEPQRMHGQHGRGMDGRFAAGV